MSKEKINYVKLKKITEKILGQGEPPEFLKIVAGEKEYNLKFGDVFKVSEKDMNEIVNLETKPYPTISKKFFESIENNFEIIKK